MNINCLVFSFLFIFLSSTGCSQSVSSSHKNQSNNGKQEEITESTNKIDPEKAAKLNIELGLAYIEREQPVRGKIKLQRALELAPLLPDVHVAFGQYYESIEEVEEAEKSYLKAIKINKNWAVSHSLYGAFLCRQGKYEKANRAFQKALEDKTYPESASVLENAGLCELAAGNNTKAKGYFEKAIRQDNHRTNSLLELAYLHYEAKSLDMAWQLYSRYLLSASQTPRSLYLGIKLARIFNYKDKEASYLILLRGEYHNSFEYQQLIHF